VPCVGSYIISYVSEVFYMQFIWAVHSMVYRPVSSVVGDRIWVLLGWYQTLGSFIIFYGYLITGVFGDFVLSSMPRGLGFRKCLDQRLCHGLMWFAISPVDAGSGSNVSPNLSECYFPWCGLSVFSVCSNIRVFFTILWCWSYICSVVVDLVVLVTWQDNLPKWLLST
jgi:hypothetical protein